MDKIQKVLVKAGRKDLAQEYYLKVARKRFDLIDLILDKVGLGGGASKVKQKALYNAFPKLEVLVRDTQKQLDAINWSQAKEVLQAV